MAGYVASPRALGERQRRRLAVRRSSRTGQTYDRNADDPAMHERYLEYRALIEDDPEWHDGVIERLT